MPEVVAVLAAGAGSAAAGSGIAGTIFATTTLSIAASNALAGIIVGTAVGGALVGLDLLLNRPPKPQAQQTPIRTEMPPRVSAYGWARLSGAYMCFEAPSASALLVLAVHDGEIDALTRFFYHDDELDLDTTATAPAFGGYVNPGPRYPKGDLYFQRGHGPNGTFQFTLGETPGAGFPDLVSYCNLYAPGLWTANHRGDGIVAFYGRAAAVGIEHQQAVWPNGPPNLSAAGRWTKAIYDPRINGTLVQGDPSTWQWSENPALCLLNYLCNHPAYGEVDFATMIQPNIDDWIEAANVCDEAVTRLYGQTHVTSQPWIDIGNTLCSLADITGIAVGQQIVFASETMTVASIGAPVDGGLHGYTLNFTAAFAYAHATNEVVFWQPPFGTLAEKRYRVGGAFKWDQDPAEVIKQLLLVMDGWLATKADGTLTLVAGKYYEPDPTLTLTDDYILDYEVQHFVPDEEAVNEYKPTYTDEDRKYNEIDAGAWQDLNDIEVRGVVRSQALQLPWSRSGTQSRRIAAARMVRNSAELRGWIRTNLWGMNVLGKRFLRLQISENAALHDVRVEVVKVTLDLASLSIVFQWVAVPTDGSLYDWDADADELPPFVSAASGKPVFAALVQPTITGTTVNAVPVSGTSVGSTLQVTIANPPADLAGSVSYVVRVAPAGSGDWTQTTLNDVVAGGSTTTISTGFVPNGPTDVQVAYQTGGGSISPWSATTTVNAAQPAGLLPVTMTASEAIAAPALVNVWSSSGAKIRHADASLGQQADGFILASVALGGTVTVYFGGELTGLSGLTPGDAWLGNVGAVTSTAPSSSVMSQVVGQIDDAAGDTLVFAPKPPVFP